MKPRLLILSLVAIGLLSGQCKQQATLIPKPRAYPRVEFPDRNYVTFSDDSCPFTFTYPDYMLVEKRTSFFGEEPNHPCWFDLVTNTLNARVHLSYHEVGSRSQYDELVSDAYRLASRINQRANYMDELVVSNERGVGGVIMEFSGPAASPLHFYLSDTSNHFLKGALYFNARVVPDSLAPVVEFLNEDIAELINSLDWIRS